jgi:hypothetical protein
MHFFPTEAATLGLQLNHSFALRRNIRIKSSKLPPDFFLQNSSSRYTPSPSLGRQLGADISNRDVRTPSFECRKLDSSRASRENEERKA